MGELDAAVVVDLPLRGEWTVERTRAHRIPSHGTDRFGQRFAFDFVRADRRRGLHLHPAGTTRLLILGGRTGDFYGWGQPVHAALEGEVVRVVDGMPERARVHVVRETWAALKNTFLAARGRLDPARLAGNHVIIRSDAAYALYAHLAPGSIPVRMGQRVAAGQEIGRVGHTGNSTAPHLHFQLMDSAAPAESSGIPCAFAEYLVERHTGWERIQCGVPARLDRIRSIR